MNVPLLDLKANYLPIKSEIDAAVLEVLDSQSFILGPKVKAFEEELAGYLGATHAIGCASGSDALLLALMALDVGPGDEVITTPYSFFATAGCIVRLGARPVFVDIEPDTFNLDVGRVEALITPRTRAIMPVHLFGQCADLDALEAIGARRGIPIVEDAAQAIGASWARRRAGTVGTIGCFSFYPSKNLGGYGDGGMMTTQDSRLDARLRALRAHGAARKYTHDEVGVNSRLDAIQAVILSVRLKYLDKWATARQHNACRYYGLFTELGLEGLARVPVQRLKAGHVYNQFVITVPQRDALQSWLKARGVGTEIYYPLPLHLQRCFASLGYGPGDFPNAEEAARTTLAIPVYPEMTEEMRRYVVETIAGFYQEQGMLGRSA